MISKDSNRASPLGTYKKEKIIPLDSVKNASDISYVGGKAVNLGILYEILPDNIPYGFSLNATVLAQIFDEDTNDTVAEIRNLIDTSFERPLRGYIDNNRYYAVRSSATIEDGKAHSFAGQFNTFLANKGYDEIARNISECLLSFYNQRSSRYFKLKKIERKAGLSIFIQEMVTASKAGVLFTCNPFNRRRETIINSSFGIGDLIVEGKITPDNIVVDDNNSIEYTIGSKKRLNIVTPSGLRTLEVPQEQRDTKSLDDEEIMELTRISRVVEETLSFSVDMEWAISKNRIYVLQARPITFNERR